MENKNPEQTHADSLFAGLSSAVPERTDIEIPEELVVGGHESLTKRMKEAPNLSDMQSVVQALSPEFNSYLDKVKISRIYPEEYDFFRSIIVKDLMKTDPALSLVEAVATVNTALSIAIDGEGRIDILRVAGAIRESEEAKATAAGIR